MLAEIRYVSRLIQARIHRAQSLPEPTEMAAALSDIEEYIEILDDTIGALDAQTTGQRLRLLRVQLRKGQAEVAREVAKYFKVSLSQPTLSNLERDLIDSPDINTLRALAEYYDMPAAYLLLGAVAGEMEGVMENTKYTESSPSVLITPGSE